MSLSKNDYFILALGIIGLLIAITTRDIVSMVTFCFIVTVSLRYRYAYYVGIAFLYVVSLSRGIDVFDLLYATFLSYLFYQTWSTANVINNRVFLINLDQNGEERYARLFMMFLGISIFFQVLTVGSLSGLLQIVPMLAIVRSALGFTAIYMISQRIYNASYFYIAYLLLDIIILVYVSVSAPQISGMLSLSTNLIALSLLAGITGLFIYENK